VLHHGKEELVSAFSFNGLVTVTLTFLVVHTSSLVTIKHVPFNFKHGKNGIEGVYGKKDG
jgi:hypothetical protein